MLRFKFEFNEYCSECKTDVYRYFGCLSIVIDNKVYYEEIGVAIFEFFLAVKKWKASDYQLLEYMSVESDISPDLMVFVNTNYNYQLYSAYQRFECKTCFSRQEICDALVDLKNEVRKQIVIPKQFDFCFE